MTATKSFAVVVFFATLICCATSAFGAPKNRLDITLEGPWMLYQGKIYQNATDPTGVSVLIAIAPGVGVATEDGKHFHLPFISTGDGYSISVNGIYCLTFDTICAQKNGSTLNFGDYPDAVKPLKAYYANPSGSTVGWDWVSATIKGTYVTALILPMPNSFSDAAVWNMKYGPQFSNDGSGYTNDSPTSIGLQLHYDEGPKSFDLFSCTAPLYVKSCTSQPIHHTKLNNYGTLSISMKAPYNDDPCDYHVRGTYPAMLKILDTRDISDTSNVNHKWGYIDPARGIDDNGQGIYTDPAGHNCYDNDPQKPGTHSIYQAHTNTLEQNISKITNILRQLQSIDAKASNDLQSTQLLTELAEPQSKLDLAFPRISQTALVKELLLSSSDAAKELSRQHSKSGKEKELLQRLAPLEKTAADGLPSKDGKDCRAPIMLVQP